jgi:hypothetical protein
VRGSGAPASIDHLVGAQQNRWRYRKAKRLGGLAVDDHLEFRRKLNGKLPRLFAAPSLPTASSAPTITRIRHNGQTVGRIYRMRSTGREPWLWTQIGIRAAEQT